MQTKKLGFGLMRLPLNDKTNAGDIDVEQVKQMVDTFLERGFTYFDTAWMYCGFQSENVTKTALVDRHPRDSYTLATKLHAGYIDSLEDRDRIFNEQLKKTGVTYFDYYLIHGIEASMLPKYEKLDCFRWLLSKKAAGLVRHAGFSFHGSAQLLDEILTKHPEMEFVQLQINYADWDNPAVESRRCYETARRHGKPVIIMEPVKGGMLATPPGTVEEVLRTAEPESSAASWAIRFAADLEGVITVLSGMSSREQMEDNLFHMKSFSGLTAGQRKTLERAREELKKIPLIPCTSCNYCAKVCPKEIGISGSFTAMNYLTLYGNTDMAKHQEEWLVEGHGRSRADACVQCGKCEEACPQHISIRKELEKVKEALLFFPAL